MPYTVMNLALPDDMHYLKVKPQLHCASLASQNEAALNTFRQKQIDSLSRQDTTETQKPKSPNYHGLRA